MAFLRGTAIVETDKGIILGESAAGRILLPGGRANRGESRFLAAIRELREETGLQANAAFTLFEYEDSRDHHKVLWVSAYGNPQPKDDLVALHYCHKSELSEFDLNFPEATNATRNIVKLFWSYKEKNAPLFEKLDAHNSKMANSEILSPEILKYKSINFL
ncbi:MAG: NUDIX domain-containing protein [Pseudanabaenaceae cyanobacterium bins.39]|nr:NUDIX domain-containing protein [Pseudanabaenaceae cyanobacterium bins.39]